mmetsp:Transcript_94711/g.267367  ORF Transcript_94711/g.267367 Transcript_94711/m.267367 type:complete len:238 (-) Transcript_94711:69-782(-)
MRRPLTEFSSILPSALFFACALAAIRSAVQRRRINERPLGPRRHPWPRLLIGCGLCPVEEIHADLLGQDGVVIMLGDHFRLELCMFFDQLPNVVLDLELPPFCLNTGGLRSLHKLGELCFVGVRALFTVHDGTLPLLPLFAKPPFLYQGPLELRRTPEEAFLRRDGLHGAWHPNVSWLSYRLPLVGRTFWWQRLCPGPIILKEVLAPLTATHLLARGLRACGRLGLRLLQPRNAAPL